MKVVVIFRIRAANATCRSKGVLTEFPVVVVYCCTWHIICWMYQPDILTVRIEVRRCMSHTPLGRYPKFDCSTTKRVPIPKDTSSESPRRHVSNEKPSFRAELLFQLWRYQPWKIGRGGCGIHTNRRIRYYCMIMVLTICILCAAVAVQVVTVTTNGRHGNIFSTAPRT